MPPAPLAGHDTAPLSVTDPSARRDRRAIQLASLLQAVYRRSGGSKWDFTHIEDLVEDLGWSAERVTAAMAELAERGYVGFAETGPSWTLATAGRDAAEELALASRDAGRAELVLRRQADRRRLLLEAWRLADGSVTELVDIEPLFIAAEVDGERGGQALEWLADRDLVRREGVSIIRLTTAGLDAIETARVVTPTLSGEVPARSPTEPSGIPARRTGRPPGRTTTVRDDEEHERRWRRYHQYCMRNDLVPTLIDFATWTGIDVDGGSQWPLSTIKDYRRRARDRGVPLPP